MGRLKVTDFYLYRWRYVLGYLAIGLLSIAALITVGLFIPGGVSKPEMDSVVVSDHTPPHILIGKEPIYAVQLPYHVLQKISIQLFGVSQLSIKLPSLLLAFISIGLLYGLLRLWFQRNTAIISTFLVATTGQFLLSSQMATPEVSYLFWNVALLFSTSMLARAKKLKSLWFIIAAIAGALSLYSPLEIYVVIALSATCLIHPHARFVVLKQPLWVLVLSGTLFVGLALPLLLSVFHNDGLVLQLFGIPTDLSILNWTHAKDIITQYVGSYHPKNSVAISPAFGLPMVLLGCVGLYRLLRAKYTAKSYIISIWAVFLIPIVIFQSSAVSFAFMPLILLVAFAIDYLIRSWYGLFPYNPYARIAGLLPLAVLVIGLTLSNIERFTYGYHYDPAASTAFTDDLSLIRQTVKQQGSQEITLLVPVDQKEFYTTYARRTHRTPSIIVIDSLPTATGQSKHLVIAAREFKTSIGTVPSSVLTTTTATDANRFYLYKNGLK